MKILVLVLVLLPTLAFAQRPTHFPGSVLTGAGTMTPRSGYFVSLTQIEQGIAWKRFEVLGQLKAASDLDLKRDVTAAGGMRFTYARGTKMIRGSLMYVGEIDRAHSPYDVGPRRLTGSVEAWIGWSRSPMRPANRQ